MKHIENERIKEEAEKLSEMNEEEKHEYDKIEKL